MKIHPLHRISIKLASYLVRGILKFRYKIQVEGLEEIKKLKDGGLGILFLPNHPAEIDPVILMSILGPFFCPRSVVVEHFYHLKGFKKILDLARVVPLPTMDKKANQWRGKEIGKTFEKIENELKRGENYIIYPSGKLKKSGLEQLGGASLVYNLLQDKTDVPVVLVRTTGLWGSCFSVAQTGEVPRFQTVLKRCFQVILKNGLFFVPKRTILIQFEQAPNNLPKDTRLIFNKHLEQWYNQYPFPGEEAVSLVPYFFWSKDTESIPIHLASASEDALITPPPEVEKEVIGFLSKLSSISASDIHFDSNLSVDLCLDSLDIAGVHLFLDKTYGVVEIEPGSLEKVKDIFKVILNERSHVHVTKEDQKIPSSFFSKWKEKKRNKEVLFPGGDVIPEVFLKSCDRMGGLIACADRNSGVFSYRELKRAPLVFCQKIKELPGEKVGVLLPSSLGAYLSILSIFLCGKIPVMLNWTAGKISLDHSLKVAQFKTVLTSKKFLDRIQLEDLSPIEDLFVFLEDIKGSITLKEKLKGLFLSFFKASKLMEKLKIQQDPDETAVILFTSGTESLPKAVPLSHRHILINQKNSFICSDLSQSDVFYGVLPPFHSFGFSLTGLLPLLFGLKIFYGPDPTDTRQMVSDIEDFKITTFCSAPSFVRSLFFDVDASRLQSLRLVVVGAERLPPDLKELLQKTLPHADLIEGYGITECSPVVTLQRMEGNRKGVGEAIPGMKICIVDPLSLKRLEIGQEGEVCISGPCVFNDYLDLECKSFFYEDGKKWYRSGDLGRLDKEGTLYLTDRLKRMMKIGGEMISLGGVEAELLRLSKENSWYPPHQEGVPLAVVARDTGNQKAEIVLFTTFSVNKELVNQVLRETGFGRIVKISDIIEIEEIPLMGTGKIHHRLLEEQLKLKQSKT